MGRIVAVGANRGTGTRSRPAASSALSAAIPRTAPSQPAQRRHGRRPGTLIADAGAKGTLAAALAAKVSLGHGARRHYRSRSGRDPPPTDWTRRVQTPAKGRPEGARPLA